MIRIRSRSDQGFRRAGVRHTPEPQTFPDGAFTPAQLEALRNESELVVEILRDPPVEERTAAPAVLETPQEEPAGETPEAPAVVEAPQEEPAGEKPAAPSKPAAPAKAAKPAATKKP